MNASGCAEIHVSDELRQLAKPSVVEKINKTLTPFHLFHSQ
jgi:hypothetical protein